MTMPKWLRDRIKTKKLELVHARAPLALEVTLGDIRSSTQKDPANCAFSCAVKRGLGATAAYFMRSVAYIEYQDRVVQYNMPGSMQKEIVAFDRAKAMEPGVYQLAPLADSKRNQKRRKKRRRSRRAGTQSAKPRATKKAVANIRIA